MMMGRTFCRSYYPQVITFTRSICGWSKRSNGKFEEVSRKCLGCYQKFFKDKCLTTNCIMKSTAGTLPKIKKNLIFELEEVSSEKCFGGYLKVYQHESLITNCIMKFAIFIPPQVQQADLPVLFALPGIKCNEQSLFRTSGIHKYATEHGIIVVSPDTSPRGCNIDKDKDNWQCGEGAGFYIDATEGKWENNYNMFSYLNKELVSLIDANFPVQPGQRSILGHSMGGHGAITSYLKTQLYLCASAFAPVCNPVRSNPDNVFPTAYRNYLGTDIEKWKEYDACELLKTYEELTTNILIDQGTDDYYLAKGELLPGSFIDICQRKGISVNIIPNNDQSIEPGTPVTFRIQEGYDHFDGLVTTFMEDHIRYHASHLKA